MSGTAIGPDWKGGARLFWSFLWRLAVLSGIAALGIGVLGAALIGAKVMSPHEYSGLASLASTLLFVILQVEAFRRLAGVYDIRIRGGHAGEQNHRRGR